MIHRVSGAIREVWKGRVAYIYHHLVLVCIGRAEELRILLCELLHLLKSLKLDIPIFIFTEVCCAWFPLHLRSWLLLLHRTCYLCLPPIRTIWITSQGRFSFLCNLGLPLHPGSRGWMWPRISKVTKLWDLSAWLWVSGRLVHFSFKSFRECICWLPCGAKVLIGRVHERGDHPISIHGVLTLLLLGSEWIRVVFFLILRIPRCTGWLLCFLIRLRSNLDTLNSRG